MNHTDERADFALQTNTEHEKVYIAPTEWPRKCKPGVAAVMQAQRGHACTISPDLSALAISSSLRWRSSVVSDDLNRCAMTALELDFIMPAMPRLGSLIVHEGETKRSEHTHE